MAIILEDIDKIEMCEEASRNVRALEELMPTTGDLIALDREEAEIIVRRCEQIIHCMRECFDA